MEVLKEMASLRVPCNLTLERQTIYNEYEGSGDLIHLAKIKLDLYLRKKVNGMFEILTINFNKSLQNNFELLYNFISKKEIKLF